jgi:hypothetical protein
MKLKTFLTTTLAALALAQTSAAGLARAGAAAPRQQPAAAAQDWTR